MSRKFLTSIDLGGNSLIAAAMEALAANPAGAKLGQFWYNTTTMYPTFWDGTAFQQFATVAYVQSVVASAGGGDMSKSVYDTNNSGAVDVAESAPWNGITGKPTTFAPSAHGHVAADISDLAAYVDSRVAALVDGAAGADDALDTLSEIITRIQQNSAEIASRAKRFAATIGDGSALTITVEHNLNTFDTVVAVFEIATGRSDVIADVKRPTANTITVGFGTAPTNGQYRVVVIA